MGEAGEQVCLRPARVLKSLFAAENIRTNSEAPAVAQLSCAVCCVESCSAIWCVVLSCVALCCAVWCVAIRNSVTQSEPAVRISSCTGSDKRQRGCTLELCCFPSIRASM